MATFKLEIHADNAAFDPDPTPELARLLRELADKVETYGKVGYPFGRLRDLNGNQVGRWALAK
jgi:hypothetical protein